MPTPRKGYFLKDGTPVPGTTTICGAYKESGALIHWAWLEGQSGLTSFNFKSAVKEILAAAKDGVLNSDVIMGVLEILKGRDYRESRDKAGNVGTVAHAMIEAAIRREDPHTILAMPGLSLPDIKAQQMAHSAFRSYQYWANANDIIIVEQEIQLVSHEYRYGGTPDAIGRVGDKLVLLDWKTSKGVYKSYLLQLAAYRQLWNENCPGQEIEGAYLVRFSKTEPICEPYYFGNLVAAWEQFKLFRAAYEIEDRLDAILEGARACMKPLSQ